MFLIVDGHGMAYRAYHGNAHNLRNSWDDGLFAYLFVDQLRKCVQNVESTLRRRRGTIDYVRVLLCWDMPGSKAQRLEIFPEYKGDRPRPPNLAKWIKDLRAAMRAVHERYGLAVDTLEADDLIAIIVEQALAGLSPAVVITRDRDLLQLLRFEDVEIYDPIDKLFLDRAGFEKLHGFPVEWWNLYRAAVGDKSDNWKGIKGTGEVGMTKAIQGAIEDGWDQQKMIDELVRDGYGETLALGLHLVALPFPEADYHTALAALQFALDDERETEWTYLFNDYGIAALDAADVGDWLT